MMPKKAKTEFLEVLEKLDDKGFVEFGNQHKSKKSNFLFGPLVKSLSKDELVTCWEQIFTLLKLHAHYALEIEETPDTVIETTPDFSCSVIQTAISFGIEIIDQLSRMPVGLFQSAVLCHDLLFKFPLTRDNLVKSIVQFCENVWLLDIDVKSELISNAFLYLVIHTTKPKATKTDVKRVYALRDAVPAMRSIPEVDQEVLLYNLKSCCSSVHYLSCPEGQKFIEHLLTSYEDYTEQFHDAIKLHLPYQNPKRMEAYGSIYFNAWMKTVKDAQPALQEKLESYCIQDLMHHAIHVPRNKKESLVPMLRKLLAVFHKQKKNLRVLKMLRDLYQPILWRAMKNANGNVRANAAQLFFDVFPLEDPTFNIVETEAELEKQLYLIQELLHDEYPVVRCISVIGVCLVMCCHWDLLSTEIKKTYFKILVEELACDSASADVRLSVAKGLKSLVEDNKLSLPHLKVVLPQVRDLFHDVSEKVRVQFCQLLLAVKNVNFIKFWEVVPLNHLLARLEEEDGSVVGKLIVELVLNSYLPENQSPENVITCCVELIKSNPAASRVFFLHVKDYKSLDSIVNLMVLLLRTVKKYVQSKSDSGTKKSNKKSLVDKENVQSNTAIKSCFAADGPIAFDNPSVLVGVFDALTVMWLEVQNDLIKPENSDLHKELLARLNMYAPSFLDHFKNKAVWMSLCFFCGTIPLALVPQLPALCISRIKALPDDAEHEECWCLLMALCNHDKSEDILLLIREWLLSNLQQDQSKATNPKGKPKKRKRASNLATPKPMLALKLFHILLTHSHCRKIILEKNCDLLKEIAEDMTYVQEAIKKSKTTLNDNQESKFLQECLHLFATLTILLHEVIDTKTFICEIFGFATEEFFTCPSNVRNQKRKSARAESSAEVTASNIWKEFKAAVCQDLWKITCDAVVLELLVDAVPQHVEFMKLCLKSEFGPVLMLNSSSFVHHLAQCSMKLNEELRPESQLLIHKAFQLILEQLKVECFANEMSPSNRTETGLNLKKFLMLQTKLSFVSRSEIDTLVMAVLKSILEALKECIENHDTETQGELEWSTSSKLLLSIVAGNAELLKLLLNFMMNWIKDKPLIDVASASIILTKAFKSSKNVFKKLVAEAKGVFLEIQDSFCNFKKSPNSDQKLLTLAKSQIEFLKKKVFTDED